jgi:hypothetical protein
VRFQLPEQFGVFQSFMSKVIINNSKKESKLIFSKIRKKGSLRVAFQSIAPLAGHDNKLEYYYHDDHNFWTAVNYNSNCICVTVNFKNMMTSHQSHDMIRSEQ